MSNNQNEFTLPEGFNVTYVYEAKKFLRSGVNQEDTADLIAEYMIDEIEDTIDDLPSESIIEQTVTNLSGESVKHRPRER